MSKLLSLKERIELYKLHKKPRKQIKLRFDALSLDLNLPILGQSTHILYKNFRTSKKMGSFNRSNSQALHRPTIAREFS